MIMQTSFVFYWGMSSIRHRCCKSPRLVVNGVRRHINTPCLCVGTSITLRIIPSKPVAPYKPIRICNRTRFTHCWEKHECTATSAQREAACQRQQEIKAVCNDDGHGDRISRGQQLQQQQQVEWRRGSGCLRAAVCAEKSGAAWTPTPRGTDMGSPSACWLSPRLARTAGGSPGKEAMFYNAYVLGMQRLDACFRGT